MAKGCPNCPCGEIKIASCACGRMSAGQSETRQLSNDTWQEPIFKSTKTVALEGDRVSRLVHSPIHHRRGGMTRGRHVPSKTSRVLPTPRTRLEHQSQAQVTALRPQAMWQLIGTTQNYRMARPVVKGIGWPKVAT